MNIETLRAEMERAGFARMSVEERHRFVGEFLLRQYGESIEKARRRPERERTAYYLSAEFLPGRIVQSGLYNTGLYDLFRQAMAEVGADIAEMEEIPDHALGNGGLGRLAACFLDSAAAHKIPLWGYGIRYRYGLFRQNLEEGFQREVGDDWMRVGDPWSIRRDSEAVSVTLGRRTIRAVPYDLLVFGCAAPGEEGGVTLLRLWQAESEEGFDFSLFDAGKYNAAFARRERDERISMILYPNDSTAAGRELRLSQELFFTEASVLDILRRYEAEHGRNYADLPALCAIQLNDTHPAPAILALIGALTDRGVAFEEALGMARQIFSYTNHTVMAEALEVWDAALLRRLSPRGWRVLSRLDRILQKEFAARGMDYGPLRVIEGERVHMARLASHVSGKINGVAPLHTEILRARVLRPFEEAFPGKIVNMTNGITQRRWLGVANPLLADFVSERIGDGWTREAERLAELKKYAADTDSLREFWHIKGENKRRLAAHVKQWCGVSLDTNRLFDVQIKRLHEYKRQLMNAFSVMGMYYDILDGAAPDLTPTVFFFGAKAAPGYRMAKAIIRYILAVSEKLRSEPAVREKLQVIFVPDYNVSRAEVLVAAAELSEQISMAGTEASGTGNMKMMLNGAPTLGTYDGANLEILAASGEENNFFFGVSASEMASRMQSYDPRQVYQANPRLARVVDSLVDGTFDDGGSGDFAALYGSLLGEGERADAYCVLGDFAPYSEARLRAMHAYRSPMEYAARGLKNTAAAGSLSSDYTVQRYAREIWRV